MAKNCEKNMDEKEKLISCIDSIASLYLDRYERMRDLKAVSIADQKTLKEISLCFPKEGRDLEEVVSELEKNVFANQAIMQHPRFFAFIPSPTTPLSWLGDVITDAYNPHAGTWMESSAASCIEKEMIRWFANQAGFPETAGGLFVSGGSIANLTALAAARHARLKEEELDDGVVYLSEQTHYSVSKALRIMGVRFDQIRIIPCDEDYRIDVALLKKQIEKDIADKKKPYLIAATAGTTNAGCIDPLEQLADLCDSYGMWLHVDGAYGASVLLSEQHKHLFQGIHRADSLTWDAHKWLFQTYACSMVLFRNRKDLAGCFGSDPEYLKDASVREEEINYWEWGIELTRPARYLKLWLTIQALGTKKISEMIDHGISMAEYVQEKVESSDKWQLSSSASLGIVNFRFAPAGLNKQERDELNVRIAKKITESGFACILTTRLKDHTVLRICCIHPDTTKKDINDTFDLLSDYADEALKELIKQ